MNTPIIFFLVTVFSILIRLYFINQPIRYDEAHNFVYFAQKPLSFIYNSFNKSNHQLLHTILTHISYKIFGSGLWAIRLPAFIFGVLSVPMTYVTARTIYNKNAAIVSMGIISASSMMIEFSTNARGFTIMCFLTLVIICIAKYLKDNSNNMFAWLIFIISSSLGLFTLTIMLYPIFIILLWLITSIFLDKSINKKNMIKNIVISVFIVIILTIILYLPAIVKNGFLVTFSRDIEFQKSWSIFFSEQWIYVKDIWNEWNRDIPIIISLSLEICFFISILCHKKIVDYSLNIFIPIVLIFIPVQFILKDYLVFTRYWLFLLPVVSASNLPGNPDQTCHPFRV